VRGAPGAVPGPGTRAGQEYPHKALHYPLLRWSAGAGRWWALEGLCGPAAFASWRASSPGASGQLLARKAAGIAVVVTADMAT
jgi:hypothetical protein